ncbi:MAG TPA: ATP-binding protein [Plantibacter sp.]|uniref:ATP-binding protein n=1 Tax=Plantibacter sp. TaxID=1871045 RepID=UPI002C4360BD|nr:ATP-binding protein [Plantibacter sp.]
MRVRVDDDGAGVPIGDRSSVFERFVRLDESRSRDAGGSGLGLSIVADVVRLHDGSVEIVDGALGGAGFVVMLPAANRS